MPPQVLDEPQNPLSPNAAQDKAPNAAASAEASLLQRPAPTLVPLLGRRAKIVCTIGPACSHESMMRAMLLHGMNVARFNFSHGGPELQAAAIERLRRVSAEMGQPVAILQDLQGPKIRTGKVAYADTKLVPGARFTITTRPVEGDERIVATTYPELPSDCEPGDTILLDDGLIELRVDHVSDEDVVCTVIDGGVLKSNKGINLPGVKVSAPALSAKDRHDVEWGLDNGVDYVALSFVRRPEDVLELRELINSKNSAAKIISKLEKPEAIDALDEIIDLSDGVMVARGDLGVEMKPQDVPLIQKKIIQRANARDKIVITATQMLESMTTTQRPTRAEASDVANAVLDGTDALMLSGETASGQFPLEALKMMSAITEKVETETDDGWLGRRWGGDATCDITGAVCEAAAHAAAALKATAIVCFTETGSTALRLAKFRPPVPILACTIHPDVARRLQLAWGVYSVLIEARATTDDLIEGTDALLSSLGVAKPGDIVVVTLGAPIAAMGSTNLLKIHRLGHADIR
jgi:pyruvate kinase